MADSTVTGLADIPSYEEYLQQSKVRNVNKNLGQNEFLALLSAQLQYQDPLEPTKDTDFIAQLAQFQSLEQMTSLSTTTSNSYYYGLAGKYIYAEVRLDNGEDAVIHGVVDRVVMQDGKYHVQVGDYLVDATKITQVYDKDLFIGDNPILGTTNLIGKEVAASLAADKDGNPVVNAAGEPIPISGVVSRVTVENGVLTAYLDNGYRVQVGNITDIRMPSTAAEPEQKEESDLIGKEVTAEFTDENGDPLTLTGIVTHVEDEDGVLTAYLDSGEKVPVDSITNVKSPEENTETGTEDPEASTEPETEPAGEEAPNTGEEGAAG